jgi:GT2 family glycosyltransferase
MASRFEVQVRYLQDHPEVDFLGTGAILITEDGEKIREYFLPSEHEEIKKIAYSNTCFFHSSVAIRKSALDRVGLYDETFKRAQDKELWLRGIKYGFCYANIPQPLIQYRVTRRSSSHQVTIQTMYSLIRIGWRYQPKSWLLDFVIYLGRKVLIESSLYKPRSLRK